jgi:hypothetical protein
MPISRFFRSGSVVVVLAMAAMAPRDAAAQFNIPDGDVAGLIAAIEQANATPGANTINLAANGMYTLTEVHNTGLRGATGLPVITSEITINGHGAVLERDSAAMFRLLAIADGDLTLGRVTLRGGHANEGGALYIDSGKGALIACTVAGNWSGSGTIWNQGTLSITDSVIRDNQSIVSGGGLRNWSGSVTLVNTTFEGNTVFDGRGGGMHNDATGSAIGCTFSDNSAWHPGVGAGGGISNDGVLSLDSCRIVRNGGTDSGGIVNFGELTAANCAVLENTSQFGAAGLWNGGDLTLVDSVVGENRSDEGSGGIANSWSATATLADCTIRDNTASHGASGGGIANGGIMTVTGTTISGNRASPPHGVGGGIANGGSGRMSLTNCTISDNYAAEGGAVWNTATLELFNCTLNANAADGSGGGILTARGVLNLTNTIVANSTGGDIVGTYTDEGHNIVQNGSGITHPTSFAADPLLGPLANNGGPTLTRALLAGSPAIDTGDCAGGAVTHDQRGVPRPQGKACDIGAFELDCYPDCDGNGVLDFLDFLCFQNAFLAGDPYADCNRDGTLDFFDFLCFQNKFLAGCR